MGPLAVGKTMHNYTGSFFRHVVVLACDPAKPLLSWQVMGHKRLLETNADIILQQKINLRAPYVTPLNVLQACTCPQSK